MIAEIEEEVDRRARALVTSGDLKQDFGELGFERRVAKVSEQTDKLALSIWDGALCGEAIFNLIRCKPLLDIAEQLCGSEIIASSVYRLRPKIPGHNKGPVPWHQDSGYFEPFCDNALVLTVWLPLVDSSEENGCLWVQPGVHERGIFRHTDSARGYYLEIPPEDLPPVEPVCAPVRKGGVLLLTNRTPHASFDNRTNRVRWSMDLRYQSAALPTNADITRLEGEISGSESEGIPPACYPPEADFLVRSRLRPHEVVKDAGTFAAIRTRHVSQPWSNRW